VNVLDAVIKILATPDIESAMTTLSDLSAEIFHAPAPSLFLLSTQQSAFICVFGKQKDFVYLSNEPLPKERHIVGTRGEFVIGFLEWVEPIAQMDDYSRKIICVVIEEIYRRYHLRNFFTHIQYSVDFTNQDTYFRDTAKLLSDILSMEIVAIHQINSVDNLDCRAIYHYPDRFGDRIDFDGDTMPPPFRELVFDTKRTLFEHNGGKLDVKFELVDPSDTQRYGFLLHDDQLSYVKAFAIFPIVFGDEFFGVLSCLTTAPFRFSSLERDVIKSAMQVISVAISNFLRFHEVKRMTDVIHDQLFSVTELEIAQSARHELQNIETEQALLIDELEALSRSARDKGLLEPLSKLKDSVIKLDAAISKLRYSGVHAAPKLEKTSVAKVWNEAGDLIKERLNMMGIKLRYVGSNLEGYYYSDWLREAFLNLLFNSLDAFRDRSRQNRSITLVIQGGLEANLFHILDYSDNAGGIAFSKLTVPPTIKEANPAMSQEQLIFQPRVTSKKSQKGRGWGLYLVRQAIRLHNGSISLRDNSNSGCTFRIQLFKNL